jgi:hypothetical protein
LDNPDYLRFLGDFHDFTGVYPQTTTAAPLKDLDWTRALLQVYDTHRSHSCRFSVRDVRTLHRLHTLFTPRELLTTELVIQTRGSTVCKTRSGRIWSSPVRRDGMVSGTIACVSGFLVNMVTQTLQLVSPCPASERWPLGYRIHASAVFSNARDFKDHLRKMVETCMPGLPESDRPISFRKDLEVQHTSTGMVLKNRFVCYRFENKDLWLAVDAALRTKQYPWNALIDHLTGRGVDVLTAMGAVNTLFEKGLLDDEP